MMQSNPSGGSGFVKQISVSMTGAVVFKKKTPIQELTQFCPVLYIRRQAGCVFPNRNFWASLMLRVADVAWY